MKAMDMSMAIVLGFFVGNNVSYCLGINPWGAEGIAVSLVMAVLLWFWSTHD
jgi:hypothetical protein